MKRMITLCLLLLFLSACCLPPSACAARAEEDESGSDSIPLYAVAAERGVWFYSEADDRSGLFILPYTYYVRVIAPGDPFCLVEYMDDSYAPVLTGYCLKSDLTFVDFLPARPYLKLQLTVVYSLPDAPAVAGDDFFLTTEVSYIYYGDYSVGSATYRYVCRDGKFGYIPAQDEIVYDLNTDYLTSASGGDPAQPQPDAGTPVLSGMQIFLLCAGCASVVAVSAFVLRGKRTSVPPRDEGDF